jgi:uncharacterized protein YecE (DUF72 family)
VIRMPAKSAKLYIGTSGWSYDDWRARFYPADVPRKKWLEWYATRFASSEINGSFYRTPSEEAVQAWREQTPPNFRFAWKASQFITNWKRLGESSANSIGVMVSRLKILGPKCGPVLFQLPARFEADGERLESFLRMLPKKYSYAFEFRHESWYAPGILNILKADNVALCFSDHHQAPAPWTVTASHVYVRGHGPGGRYKGHYSERTLRLWARRIRRWQSDGLNTYVYFDNDQKSAAPADAQKLLDLL